MMDKTIITICWLRSTPCPLFPQFLRKGANVIYDTDSLDSLKQYLVVTATYSDSSTATVPSADYTLSGTLTVGTSTITVSYGGKTTTFTVTVTESQSTTTIDLTQDLQQGQIQKPYPYISTSVSGEPTYSTNHNNRVSYVGVALEGDSQHRYTFNYTTSLTGSTNIGIQYVTDKAKVNNHETLTDNTNKLDLGWQNNGFKFVPPTDCYIWITFRAGTGSTAVVPSDFTSVTITVEEITPGMLWYNWDLTQSLVDSIEGREIVLSAATGVPNATQSSSGLSFNAATQIAYLGQISPVGKTFEIDVSSFDFAGDNSHHVRFFMNANSDASNSFGNGALIYRSGYGWSPYGFKNQSGTNTRQWGSVYDSSLGVNAINGKTVKIVFSNDGITKSVYLDNDLIGTNNTIHFDGSGNMSAEYTFVGGINSLSQADGDQCYNMTITGIRVYENT